MPRISRRFTRHDDLLARASRLAANISGNIEELSAGGVSPDFLTKLEEKVALIRRLDQEHAVLTAKKQEVYQQLRQTLDETARLTTLLETMIQHSYGPQSESLAGFGIPVSRRRKKRAASPETVDDSKEGSPLSPKDSAPSS